MQILHPFVGSLQQHATLLADPDRYRPARCPQCDARQPLSAHGFYHRTLVDGEFDGAIPVRRYLCRSCRRTVSLLPEFVLPYLRFSITVIARFLTVRLREGGTRAAAARAAGHLAMPYQRGQGWVRRFLRQATALAAALVAWTPVVPAPTFALRALHMRTAFGWIPAHRVLFAALRVHLLGWPASLAPVGTPGALSPPTQLLPAGGRCMRPRSVGPVSLERAQRDPRTCGSAMAGNGRSRGLLWSRSTNGAPTVPCVYRRRGRPGTPARVPGRRVAPECRRRGASGRTPPRARALGGGRAHPRLGSVCRDRPSGNRGPDHRLAAAARAGSVAVAPQTVC